MPHISESCPKAHPASLPGRIRDFDCPHCRQAMRWPSPVSCHSPEVTLACPRCGKGVTVSVAVRFEYQARIAG